MDIKKLEKEFENKLKDEWAGFFGNKKELIQIKTPQATKWFRQAIIQVVESVPADKKEDYILPNGIDGMFGKGWLSGYNQHIQEIKQWKEKMLKELKEEK